MRDIIMLDFSKMAWQPCILKQAPGYNDPTAYHDSYIPINAIRLPLTAKQCQVLDTYTNTVQIYDSLSAAGEALHCGGRNISRSIKNNYLVQHRFKCSFV
jgi:hypothetical protein